MQDWQDVAQRNPCFLAEETMHKRFVHRHPLGSVVLTINSGYE
jgi:hypothetical protein